MELWIPNYNKNIVKSRDKSTDRRTGGAGFRFFTGRGGLFVFNKGVGVLFRQDFSILIHGSNN